MRPVSVSSQDRSTGRIIPGRPNLSDGLLPRQQPIRPFSALDSTNQSAPIYTSQFENEVSSGRCFLK